MKAMKMTFAALLLAGSTGLAMAQGADSGGVATGKPANSDTLSTSKQQSQELKQKPGAPAMQQKNTGMPTDARNPANAGPDESGTAKDTAGSGTQRNPAAQKQ